MTLTYGQDCQEWSEQVKLHEQYHYAKFDIHHIYGVWENPNVEVFIRPRHLVDPKHVNYFAWTQLSQKIYCASCFECIYSGHESKTCNLQFIFLTHLWPETKSRSSILERKMYTPSRVIIMQSLKYLALIMSEKKPTLKFFNLRNMSIISLEYVWSPKRRYIHDLRDVHRFNQIRTWYFQFNPFETHVTLHIYHTYIVLENRNVKTFVTPAVRPAGPLLINT